MIDLNSADAETLARQLEISPRLARRIVAMRPFRSAADLGQVWGIDPRTWARLAPLVTVASPETWPAPQSSARPVSTPLLVRWLKSPALWLAVILLVGAYFRFVGLNWDENLHQHPDERFITMVGEKLQSVKSLADYFNTNTSSLNPIPYGSYTYGMLPLFLTRYVAEWVKMTDYDRIVLVGRALSGLFDLSVVLMLYLLGSRLYNRRVGLLAAALSAAAVLPIQLSHYWTVDSFSTVFVVAGFYFAVRVARPVPPAGKSGRGHIWSYVLFGLMAGLATACKVNTLPVFGVIILAGLINLVSVWRQPAERASVFKSVLQGWAAAGVMAVLAFRVFQPYAFLGPGFLGVKLNPRWLEIMREVTNQVAGKSEWPPNHHWTSRPVTYAWTNMVVWGLGLPLGLAAWLGWAWAAWRCWQGDWRRHLLPVVWVGGYFLWQNFQFWRYMRYLLPIYPLIILLAAWALIEAFDRARSSNFRFQIKLKPGWLAGFVLVGVVAATYAYAFAFTRIYTRPHTRVAASRWILENIPGPLNVIVDSPQGPRSYPIPIPSDQAVVPGQPLTSHFEPVQSGTATTLTAARVRLAGADIRIRLSTDPAGDDILTDAHQSIRAEDQGHSATITFPDVDLEGGRVYYLHYTIHNGVLLTIADSTLRNESGEGSALSLDWSLTDLAPGMTEGSVEFTPAEPVHLNRLVIGNLQMAFSPVAATLQVRLARDEFGTDLLGVASATGDFIPGGQSESLSFSFPPVGLEAGKTYYVTCEVVSGPPLILEGDTFTLETSWDDALPLRVDGYDPLGGIYAPLNLELYEPDTVAKREKMLDILSQANYIVIPSNRAYDAMPRLPLRYPLTLKYYQALFGCECSGDAMEATAYQAVPPREGPLGFRLVATFESDPTLGPFSISDQTADESFTVYDHPKVLIFQKAPDFSLEKVRAILESADLSQVLDQAPLLYTLMPTGLRLPPDRLAAQAAGGTWYEMFDPQSILNRNQTLGVLAWYLTLLLLGWLAFPLVSAAFPGLSDYGYPAARLVALLLMAWVAWMLGSFKILPFTQATLWLSAGVLAVVGIGLAVLNRNRLAAFIRARWLYLLSVEGLFLALFLFDLAVRLGNPDLWHPWLGGEKPMDFAFFNAVLKAVYFPPANPWLSGHYLNYYYYGQVIGAVLTKLLGIVPSIAYNLILPTWFAMTGAGVFCVAFNLAAGRGSSRMPDSSETGNRDRESAVALPSFRTAPYLAGIAAVILMLLLGNLFQVRQLWQYLPQVSAPNRTNLGVLDQVGAVVSGAVQVLTGQASLPGDKGTWYFAASRPILHDGPDTPIAEFPYFSFLYGDLHPHVWAMPILFAALAWMLSALFMAGQRKRWPERIAVWFVAGLVLGVLRPTHTWDFPTVLGLGALTVAWETWRTRGELTRDTILRIAGRVALVVGLAVAMYYPFSQWFGTEYTSLELWKGARTPLSDYLTVHGLFLFILVSFLVWETRLWLGKAAASWLSKPMRELLTPVKAWMAAGGVGVVVGLIVLWIAHYQVLVLGLPVLAWVGALLARKNQPLQKQVILGLLGVGLGLTMVVEVVVLKGDVGRSNMVFRLYTEVWALFSVAAGAALVGLIPAIRQWSRTWRRGWLAALTLLVLAAGIYTAIATPMKMNDRWPGIDFPPHNLDGMAFMLGNDRSGGIIGQPTQGAVYDDDGHLLNLASDYAGIRLMQDYVVGTPTIVEGQTPEYRWGSRYSVYTGLPTVVGWSWHTRQHNSALPGSWIEQRINEVNDFYNTTDPQAALGFLWRYHVEYIIVGDLERAYYSADGLAKFPQMVQQGLLQVAFGDASSAGVTIYRAPQWVP